MDDSDILEYMKMGAEQLGALMAGDDPPLAAVRAAAVLDFMEAYHLQDLEDGLQQFVRLRRSQADLLGLRDPESARFMDGFPDGGEYPPKKGV